MRPGGINDQNIEEKDAHDAGECYINRDSIRDGMNYALGVTFDLLKMRHDGKKFVAIFAVDFDAGFLGLIELNAHVG